VAERGVRELEAVEEKVSYVKEMFSHKASVYGLLRSLAAGAVLAIPFGFGIGALPLIAFGTGAALAALFVPSSPKFREKVDLAKRRGHRERMRDHLTNEITLRSGPDHPFWTGYHRMRERLESLTKMASNRKNSLTLRDVERLDDATVDFLGLWLARMVIYDRQQAMDEDELRRKLDGVNQQLERELGSTDRRQLEKARKDLEQVLERRDRLKTRDASLEAAMLAMCDTFDEVYQGVMTNPNASDINSKLQEAVERMHIQEDLGAALDDDLGEMFRVRRTGQAVRAKSA
jgi:hypothetical protein